ncbi:methyltransferase domain-containing protein [Candidatus Fermentibacteria bacterium]|nr:methyltransferase domain-containing protein [Candidatus Fermentibacteria bacterium]
MTYPASFWDSYSRFFQLEEELVFPPDHREMAFYEWLVGVYPGNCLELGAGYGRLAGCLSGASRLVALEPSKGMLSLWQPSDKGRTMPVRGLGQHLPLSEGSIDLVVFAYNGYHCLLRRKSRIALLRECRRVLASGGALCMETCPAFGWREETGSERKYDCRGESVRLRLDETFRRLDATGTVEFEMVYTSGCGDDCRLLLELALLGFDDVLSEVGEAGLEIVRIWGDYDRSDYAEELSPRMLLLARRPRKENP